MHKVGSPSQRSIVFQKVKYKGKWATITKIVRCLTVFHQRLFVAPVATDTKSTRHHWTVRIYQPWVFQSKVFQIFFKMLKHNKSCVGQSKKYVAIIVPLNKFQQVFNIRSEPLIVTSWGSAGNRPSKKAIFSRLFSLKRIRWINKLLTTSYIRVYRLQVKTEKISSCHERHFHEISSPTAWQLVFYINSAQHNAFGFITINHKFQYNVTCAQLLFITHFCFYILFNTWFVFKNFMHLMKRLSPPTGKLLIVCFWFHVAVENLCDIGNNFLKIAKFSVEIILTHTVSSHIIQINMALCIFMLLLLIECYKFVANSNSKK